MLVKQLDFAMAYYNTGHFIVQASTKTVVDKNFRSCFRLCDKSMKAIEPCNGRHDDITRKFINNYCRMSIGGAKAMNTKNIRG